MPRHSIFNQTSLPDTSGEVYLDAYANHATNDRWDLTVLVFEDGSTRTSIFGSFDVPSDYASGANLVVTWTCVPITGDVEWDFDYRAVGGNDTESFDQTGEDESVNSNDTAPSALHERLEHTIALTDGNFAAGDTVEFELARDKSDAGDTLADEALLFDAFFEYSI